jgi:hypothetical protein
MSKRTYGKKIEGKKIEGKKIEDKKMGLVVPLKKCIWALSLSGLSLNAFAQDPAQDPNAKQAPEVPVVVEPAEELPIPEEQPQVAPGRSSDKAFYGSFKRQPHR